MDFMLLLLGIILVAVLCAARSIVIGWRQPRARAVRLQPRLRANSTNRGHIPIKRKRGLPSISIQECETLIRAPDGVLFVSVSETGEPGRLPFHDMYPLVMTPGQLAAELRWFPPNSCVVLCGDVTLFSSVLDFLENVPEVPPLYMLRDRSSHWEVA